MIGALAGWFKALSLFGKIGVTTVGIVGATTVVAVATPPVIEVKTEVRAEQISYSVNQVKEATMAKGETKIKTPGQNGTKDVTYEVTYTDGKETNKIFKSEVITNEPVTQIVLVGTREVVTEPKDESVPFSKTTINDPTLAKGQTKIITAGVNGTKRLTYEVVKIDGQETERKLIKEEIILNPVTEVTAKGTKPAPNCDPNYSPCVPNVSYDLDCPDIGFSVVIIGYDRHGFDGNDNDGYGCESY